MTAMNIMVLQDRAIVMTDGAAIDENGRIVEIAPKGFELKHMHGFMVTTGSVQVSKGVMHTIELFADIDDLAENGEQCLRDTRDILAERYPAMFDCPWSVRVIGWSDALDRPRCVAFDNNIDGVHFIGDERTWIAPSVPSEVMQGFFAAVSLAGGREHFHPLMHCVPLMQAQRRQRLNSADGPHFVGGHVEVVEITRSSISRRMVWNWPDEVGELIAPTGYVDGTIVASGNVVPLAGDAHMSRQQRREAARRAA